MDLSVTPDFRNNTRHIIDVSTEIYVHWYAQLKVWWDTKPIKFEFELRHKSQSLFSIIFFFFTCCDWQLDQASLGMPDRSYLLRGLNDSAVAGYYKLMVESAVMLGANRERAEVEMLDALKFETILANVRFMIHLHLQCI